MKKRVCILLLALTVSLALSGCRRRPIETEAQTETETISETETETKKETETEKETVKQTEKKASSKTTVAPKTTTQTLPQSPITTSQTPQSETTAQTEAPASSQCPYCGQWFSSAITADGSSEYSNHVYYEQNAGDDSAYDSSGYYTGSDGAQYAQCPYCFQSFSTAADESGYSPYSEHVAQESAYAATLDDGTYTQCPYCGLWLGSDDYADHIANGW
ncbi:MAG: hypothetical protein Q4B57_09670 [Eubacteriales bacterium]|nr:hypothetical protein [Eubacteriales bacterium]